VTTRAGALWWRLDGLRVAVFEFVDGQPPRDHDLSAAGTIDRVARLMAAIHAATPAPAVPAETFTVWADGLRRHLAELESERLGGPLRLADRTRCCVTAT
jgi:Ser/Thr protein kinase RdoA (MazF antagonist)